MNNNTSSLKTLSLFGQDFENHGGLRALALEDYFSDWGSEEPIDCLNEMHSACCDRIGVGLTFEGMNDVASMHEAVGVCYKLRMKYGHESWVQEAMLAYRTKVLNEVPVEAAKAVEIQLAEARARYAALDSHEMDKAFNTNLRAVIGRLEEAKKSISRDLETLTYCYI